MSSEIVWTLAIAEYHLILKHLAYNLADSGDIPRDLAGLLLNICNLQMYSYSSKK